MKRKLLIMLILFFPFMINAEEIKMEWQKSWGGNGYDSFLDGAVNSKDETIFAGDTQRNMENMEAVIVSNAMIIKYDQSGNIMWQKKWYHQNDDYYNDSGFNSVEVMSDDSIVAVGYYRRVSREGNTYSFIDPNSVIVKYDTEGNVLWEKHWGGENNDIFNSVTVTENDEIIVVGYTSSYDTLEELNYDSKLGIQAIMIKYDKEGNLMWQKTWGDTGNDKFDYVVITPDDGFMVSGETDSDFVDLPLYGEYTGMMVKFDKNGNEEWKNGVDDDLYTSIIPIADGYIASLWANAEIEKYDFSGKQIWNKQLNEYNGDCFDSLAKTMDGGFLASGEITGKSDIFKFDKNGNIEWNTIWEGRYNPKIAKTSDGFIIYAKLPDNLEGFSSNGKDDAFVAKYSIIYDIENVTNTTNENNNGTSTVEQQGRYGIVKPTPNEGYEVDKIIVKDKSGNVLDVEVTKQEDGTYSFELYTDVSVEVLFKEKLVNPKTGVSSFIGVMFTLMLIGISSFFMIRNCNNSYEL